MKVRLVWIVLLGLVLTGCYTDSGLEEEPEDIGSPYTQLTMFAGDLIASDYSTPVGEVIKEATGVELVVQMPVGHIEESIDIMVMSGDYPDMLMVKNTAKLVDAHAYIDLEPLLKRYGPNLMELYEPHINRLRYSLEDPSIYVLPTSPVNEVNLEPSMGFQLQHAVVRALGYPEIKTVEDFENAIRTYKEMFPTINGEETIGITLLADDWRWMITMSNPGAFVHGKPDDGQWNIDPVTYEASYRFSRSDEKEFYRWLNHMYNTGLIDPDSFVQKFEAYEAKIASGQVLGLIDARWQYEDAEKIIRETGDHQRMYGQYPVQMDISTSAADFRDVGYLGGYGIGISVDCEDPVAAIQYLDYLASMEGQILRNWGIEGVNYTRDSNGAVVVPEDEMRSRLNDSEYSQKTGVDNYIYPFPTWGNNEVDEYGNHFTAFTLDYLYSSQTNIEKEVLEAYGVTRWAELYPASDDLRTSDWGTAWNIPIPERAGMASLMAECEAIAKFYLIEAIVSPAEEFDQHWEEMQQKLQEIGVEELNRSFTELVMQRVESWK